MHTNILTRVYDLFTIKQVLHDYSKSSFNKLNKISYSADNSWCLLFFYRRFSSDIHETVNLYEIPVIKLFLRSLHEIELSICRFHE